MSFGMEVTDSLIFLNTSRIQEWLMRGEQIRLGTNVSIAAGPTGVFIRGQQLGLSSNSSLIYSTSKGIFLGAAFEGSAIAVAPEEHVTFYKPLYKTYWKEKFQRRRKRKHLSTR